MKLKPTPSLPWNRTAVASKDGEERATYFQSFMLGITDALRKVSAAVNKNREDFDAYPTFVSQNDQPTPDAGQLLVWKDADAGPGSPTHYIVYHDGADVVTFASEETA